MSLSWHTKTLLLSIKKTDTLQMTKERIIIKTLKIGFQDYKANQLVSDCRKAVLFGIPGRVEFCDTVYYFEESVLVSRAVNYVQASNKSRKSFLCSGASR